MSKNQTRVLCTRKRFHRSRPAAGFSVIELLVLIGVLGVLMAMLLPVMSTVRVQAQRTNEQNHARQLMIGFMAYANINDDRVLPGFAPAHFRVFDEKGQLIKGSSQLRVARQRYPLRLAPFLDFDIRALMLDEVREQMERFPRSEETETDYLYAVSFTPSLGMNIQWVGGNAAADPPAMLSPSHPDFALYNQIFDMNRYYVSRTGQVRHPERLIVFASARGTLPIPTGASGDDGDGNGGETSTMTIPAEGSYQILSPYSTELSPGPRWSEQFDAGDEPASYGYLSFRYNREAVTAFFDGSVGMIDQHQARDMRHWSNWATDEEWMLPFRTQ